MIGMLDTIDIKKMASIDAWNAIVSILIVSLLASDKCDYKKWNKKVKAA